MPRSGMWMISIKKIIGISMLFISLKYLILLIPDLYAYMILGSITLILLYKEVNKIEIKKIFLSSWHEYMLLFLMIFSCGFMFFSAYNIFYKNKKNNEYKIHFIHSFDMAVSCAKSQNKYVLVDFTADWCSLCKSLENKHFNNIIFWNMLDPRIVAVKIDCTSWEDPETQKYLEQYNIKGLPTILVINPETKETVLQFDSKIITWTTEEVAQKIIDACVG
jgi:thiol:disulfide interchange protein DsbD